MRTRHLRGHRRDERGAVLVIVAAFVIVAVIMLAAVVDLGGQRQERKEVTLSTDAAALAAAGVADMEDDDLRSESRGTLVDCALVQISERAPDRATYISSDPSVPSYTVQAAVDRYLAINGESNPVDCKVARTSYKEGYVIVSADEIVDYSFGPALGINEGDVSGASVAAVESNDGGGLRPIGICDQMEGLAGVAGYEEIVLEDLVSPGGSEGYTLDSDGYVVNSSGAREPVLARFPIERVKGGSCADALTAGSGNFGKLDFDPDAVSTDCDTTGYFCHDFEEGYYGEPVEDTKGDTGNNWSSARNEASASYLELEVGQFWAPVFNDMYLCTGPLLSSTDCTAGSTFMDLDYFVQMRMVNHCFTGSCRFDGTTWFDFEISRVLSYADWSSDELTDDSNLQQSALCAMEDDSALISAGCPPIIPVTSTTPPSSSTTTTTTPACVITEAVDPTLSPSTPARNPANDHLTENLTVDVPLVLEPCSGLSVEILREDDGAVFPGACCSDTFAGYSAAFSKNGVPSEGLAWTPGTYRVRVKVDGNIKNQNLTFTL